MDAKVIRFPTPSERLMREAREYAQRIPSPQPRSTPPNGPQVA